MTDERPRPRYGEYASPEHQAERSGVPAAPVPPAGAAPAPGNSGPEAAEPRHPEPANWNPQGPTTEWRSSDEDPRSAAAAPRSMQAPDAPYSAQAPDAPYSAPYSAPIAKPERRRRLWDVILSSILLAWGLAVVLTSVPQYANLSRTLEDAFATQGLGPIGSPGAASAAGLAINISNVVIWGITALITTMLIRARRISFYVPVAGAVLAGIVVGIVLAVLLVNDPSFMSMVTAATSVPA